MFKRIRRKFNLLEAMYGPFEWPFKGVMYHRAFCEVCVEQTKLARVLDNLIPLHLNAKDVPVLLPHQEALNGFRILHITDLHLHDNDPAGVKRVKKVISGLSVDLAVLTGDNVKGQGTAVGTASLAETIRDMVSETMSTYGFWATLGNHDHPSMAEAFQHVGIPCLQSGASAFFHRGCPIILSGFNPYYSRDGKPAGIVTLRESTVRFGVMLCHYTEYADWVSQHGYRLYLAGHTHGPQIAGHYHRGMGDKDKLSGIWHCNHMVGHTSNGAGTSLYPVRLGRKAEVALLTLRPV